MLEKTMTFIQKIIELLLVGVSIFILVLILINVGLRFFGFSSIFFVNEIVRLAFIWFCGLGIVAAIFSQEHMKLDIFEWSPKWRRVLSRLSRITFSVFFLVLASSGIMVVNTHLEMGRTLKTLPYIPFWSFSILLPISFTISVVVIVLFLIKEK